VVLEVELGLSACASLNVSIANVKLKDAFQYRDQAKLLYEQGSYEESVAEAKRKAAQWRRQHPKG